MDRCSAVIAGLPAGFTAFSVTPPVESCAAYRTCGQEHGTTHQHRQQLVFHSTPV